MKMMKRKSTLLALMLAPLIVAAAVPRVPGEASQTARDVAQRSDREIESLWENLSRGLDSLKNAQRTGDVNAVLSLAQSSTNSLARITNNIEVFQERLLNVMSNQIDRQPIDRTVKQELRGYVENDLQSLELVKSIACEDLDAIGSFLSRHQTEWTAMIEVLTRMYPEPDCMQIMQKHFSAATDELRNRIESHRAAPPSDEMPTSASASDSVAGSPIPIAIPTPSASVAAPAPTVEPDAAPLQVPPPDPNEIIAQDRARHGGPPPASMDDGVAHVEKSFGAAVGLSQTARRIGVLVRMGYTESELNPRIRHSGPFNLTGDQIVYLKASGVSENLIEAMLKRDRALRN